jgi:zinc transport system substrate-binding protein
MDPHLWLDFSYDQIIVAQIARAFSEQDPEGSDFYHQNALKYQKKLADLDQKYNEGLKNCRHRKIFLGGHSAFAYLARRYHLEQIPVYGISPDAEPSPKRLAEITDLARKQHIKAIYFEELVSDKMAKTLAEEVGAMVLMLNPGANLTQEHLKSGVTFISLMEQNLENLQKGQVCE